MTSHGLADALLLPVQGCLPSTNTEGAGSKFTDDILSTFFSRASHGALASTSRYCDGLGDSHRHDGLNVPSESRLLIWSIREHSERRIRSHSGALRVQRLGPGCVSSSPGRQLLLGVQPQHLRHDALHLRVLLEGVHAEVPGVEGQLLRHSPAVLCHRPLQLQSDARWVLLWPPDVRNPRLRPALDVLPSMASSQRLPAVPSLNPHTSPTTSTLQG